MFFVLIKTTVYIATRNKMTLIKSLIQQIAENNYYSYYMFKSIQRNKRKKQSEPCNFKNLKSWI